LPTAPPLVRLLAAAAFFLAAGAAPAEAQQKPRAGEPAPRPAPAKQAPASTQEKEETVLVPAGEFTMGSPGDDKIPVWEKPEHVVKMKPYRIGRFEVTNAEYARFLKAIKDVHPITCSPEEPPGKDHTPTLETWADPEWNAPEKPVVGVDWYDAYAYCAWAGERLPTEAEWEKAARDNDKRHYPWGSDFAPGVLVGNFADEAAARANPDWKVFRNYDDGFVHTAPVGSFPEGKSPYGVEDMAGNVWEWVSDWFGYTTYTTPDQVDPTGPPSGRAKVLRGGSFDSTPSFIRSSARHRQWPAYRGSAVGFRCARDVPE